MLKISADDAIWCPFFLFFGKPALVDAAESRASDYAWSTTNSHSGYNQQSLAQKTKEDDDVATFFFLVFRISPPVVFRCRLFFRFLPRERRADIITIQKMLIN